MPPSGYSAWLSAEDVMSLFTSGAPSKLTQELSRGVDPNQTLEIPALDPVAVTRIFQNSYLHPVPSEMRHFCRVAMRDLLIPVYGNNGTTSATLASASASSSPQPLTTPQPAAALAAPGAAGKSKGGKKAAPAAAAPAAAAAATAVVQSVDLGSKAATASPEDEDIAGLRSQWGWDPSWDEAVVISSAMGEGGSREGAFRGCGGSGTISAAAAADLAALQPYGPAFDDARWPLVLVACLVGNSPQLLERLLKAGADPNAVHGRTGMTALICLARNDRLGPAAKREAVQLLAKAGFNRWGAVRRDILVDAVLTSVQEIVHGHSAVRHHLRVGMLPVAAAAGRGRGGGVGGGGGGGLDARSQALVERYQRIIKDQFELLEELLRRRAWPLARGCPLYLADSLIDQVSMAVALLDANATRLVELLAGTHAEATGLGLHSTCTRRLAGFAMVLSKQHSGGQSQGGAHNAMKPAVLLKRLAAAGLRWDEPGGTDHRCLLSLEIHTDPRVMAAALDAGLLPDSPPCIHMGPQLGTLWGSLLAEVVAEDYPPQFLEALLRAGADPRQPVLGCVRPLALAALARNTPAYQALLKAGAHPDDGPDPTHPPLPPQQLGSLLLELKRTAPSASQPVLPRSLGQLLHCGPKDLLNLTTLLVSSNCPADALTLLAAIKAANSRLLRTAMQQQQQQQQHRQGGAETESEREVAGAAPWGPGSEGGSPSSGGEKGHDRWPRPLASIVLEEPLMAMAVEAMESKPACPYLPHLLQTLPSLLKWVADDRRLAPLLVAPITSLADRLDPPARRRGRSSGSGAAASQPPTAAPTAAAGKPTADCNRSGSSSGSGSSDSEEATAVITSTSTPAAAGCVPTTPKVTTAANGQTHWSRLTPLERPDWPPEAEVPYEVLAAVLRLPYTLAGIVSYLDDGERVLRTLAAGGCSLSAIRIASAILRDHHCSTTAGAAPLTTAAPTASTPSTSNTSASTNRRWRLLGTIFGRTLPALGPSVEGGARVMPPQQWVSEAVLCLYHDPWVRALVANATVDAIARGTHEVAAPAVAGSGGSGGEDQFDNAAAERRLANKIETVMRTAVADMSYNYCCSLNEATSNCWVAGRVAAALRSRKAAAAAAATSGSGGSGASGGGGAAVAATSKLASAGGGKAATKRPSAVVTSSYAPYDACLSAVPPWVQAACCFWTWEVLVAVQQLLHEDGSGLPLARSLMKAAVRVGPPVE